MLKISEKKFKLFCLQGYKPGFNIPRGPGAYAPKFCCGPLDFSDWGPKIVSIITGNTVFDPNFYRKTFPGPYPEI